MPSDPFLDKRLQAYNEDKSWPPKAVVDDRRLQANARRQPAMPAVKVEVEDYDHAVEKVSKRFDWVWKILLVIGAAALAGWKGRDLLGVDLKPESIKSVQDDVAAAKKDIANLTISQQLDHQELGHLKEELDRVRNDLDKRAPELVEPKKRR